MLLRPLRGRRGSRLARPGSSIPLGGRPGGPHDKADPVQHDLLVGIQLDHRDGPLHEVDHVLAIPGIGEEPGQRLHARSGSISTRVACSDLMRLASSSVSFDSTASDCCRSLFSSNRLNGNSPRCDAIRAPTRAIASRNPPRSTASSALRTAGNSRGSVGTGAASGPASCRDSQTHQAAVGQEEHRFDGGVAQVAEAGPSLH